MQERITSLPYTHIALDACCVINLLASGELAAILAATHKSIAVAEHVVTVELRSRDLQPLIKANLFTIAQLANEQERLLMITYAYVHDLEDGESWTGAIALSRNWAIATDDGKAMKSFQKVTPGVALITTPDLIHHWAITAAPSPLLLHKVLENIHIKGGYYPGAHHPLHPWWRRMYPYKPR